MVSATPTGKRLHKIVLCVSEEERALLRSAAASRHIELAAWVRSVALQAADDTIASARLHARARAKD